MQDKVKFYFLHDVSDREKNIYHGIKVVYDTDGLYTKDGGGNFALYLDDSYISVDFDIESSRVGNFGGYLNLSEVTCTVLELPKNLISGILCVEKLENLLAGCGRRIDFSFDCKYDRKNCLMQFGLVDKNQTFYKFLGNAYAQLTADGFLQGILITDIQLQI